MITSTKSDVERSETHRTNAANISFGIRAADLRPDEVSAALGIQPTHAFAKGDEYASAAGVRRRPFGVWQLRSEGVVESADLNEHALFILDQFEPKIGVIRTYLADPDYYVDVRIWWESASEVGSYVLSSAVIARLAALCREVNFSFLGGARSSQ